MVKINKALGYLTDAWAETKTPVVAACEGCDVVFRTTSRTGLLKCASECPHDCNPLEKRRTLHLQPHCSHSRVPGPTGVSWG